MREGEREREGGRREADRQTHGQIEHKVYKRSDAQLGYITVFMQHS